MTRLKTLGLSLSICLFLLLSSASVFGAEQGEVTLTPEEQAWIETHVVKFGVEEWPLIIFIGKDGNVSGLAGEYCKLVAERTGLRFESVSGIWDDLVDGFREGTIDVLPASYYNEERTAYGIFSQPYFLSKEYIYVRSEDRHIRSIDDLGNKRIAVSEGYGTIPKLREYLSEAIIIETDGLLTSINALLNGEVDAIFEAQLAMQQVLQDNSITGLKGISQTAFPASPFHFWLRKDAHILMGIIQKGLDSITDADRQVIKKEWLFSSLDDKEMVLTHQENEWLAQHREMRLGVDPAWPPFDFIDDAGKHAGVASEYFRLLGMKLDVKLPVAPGVSWSQVIEEIKAHRIDVVSAIAPTPQRSEFLLFTKPYIKMPVMVFGRNDAPIVEKVTDIKGGPIAVVKGYAVEEFLRTDHPDLDLMLLETLEIALEAVIKGDAVALVEPAPAVTYALRRQGIEDIKVIAPTPYFIDISIGVRKDWPDLIAILNKALDSLPDESHSIIMESWTNPHIQERVDWAFIWKVLFGVLSISGIILFVVIRSNKKIAAKEIMMRAMSDASHDAVIMINDKGIVMFWNSAAEQMFGFSSEEAMGQCMHHLFVQEEYRSKALAGLREFAKTGEGPVVGSVIEHTALNKDGEPFPVEIAISSFRLGKGWYAVGAIRDITERKETEEELQIKEQRLRSYFSNSLVGVTITHPSKGWIEVNQRFQDMLGYNFEELKVLTWADLSHCEDLEADLERYNQLLAGTIDNYTLDKRFNHKDGNFVYTNLTVSCERDDAGEVTMVLGSYIDITERIKAQKERDDAFEVVTGSINYATSIQRSIFPTASCMHDVLPEHFVLWEPRDKVGGDFYFLKPWGLGKMLVLGDCTGHGVPGAFMTLIGNGALEMALLETPPGETGTLLQRSHQLIQQTLNQDTDVGDSDDGMEMGVCYLALRKNKLVYSGARFSLFIVKDGDVREFKGDKSGLGYRNVPQDVVFSKEEMTMEADCTYYLTTDGLIDQIGGEKRVGFGKKRFKRLLLELETVSMSERSQIIYETLEAYQGDEKRRDDVAVLGFKYDVSKGG